MFRLIHVQQLSITTSVPIQSLSNSTGRRIAAAVPSDSHMLPPLVHHIAITLSLLVLRD